MLPKLQIAMLFKDRQGYYHDEVLNVSQFSFEKDNGYLDHKVELLNSYQQNNGYEIVDIFFEVNGSDEFYKKRLEFSLKVLIETDKEYSRYVEQLAEQKATEELIDEVVRLQEGYLQDVLMVKVARRVHSCLIRDIEVTNEIALQAYDRCQKGENL